MKKTCLSLALAGALAIPAFAGGPPTLNISLGIRETGSTAAIGDDGGTSGGIEWVNLDGQQLVLDGTWQQFTWDLDADTLTAFAGATADGALTGSAGTIEHIRINKGANGYGGRYNIWIDDIVNSTDPNGPPPPGPIPTTVQDWEAAAVGDEVAFQEPGFSGSTAGNLTGPNFSRVDDSMAFTGLQSYNVNWKFGNLAPSSWLRLTTFNGSLLPGSGSPTIRFDQDSVVSVWIKGVPEPGSLALLGLSSLALLRRRK